MKNSKSLPLIIASVIGALFLITGAVYIGTLPLVLKINALNTEPTATRDHQQESEAKLAEIEALQSELVILQERVTKQSKAYLKITNERDQLYKLVDRLQNNNEALQSEALNSPTVATPTRKTGTQRDIERSLELATVSLYNKEWGYGTADINYQNAVQANKQFLIRRDNKPLGIILITEVTATQEAIFEPLAGNFPLDMALKAGDAIISVPAGYPVKK